MTVTVSVYQKNGLCRGPAIGNARFEAVFGFIVVTLTATNGPPLSGTEHVYTVARPPGVASWDLRVDSPSHQPWRFWVNDLETHEVWLVRNS